MKIQRQAKILDLIRRQEIETQEELTDRLRALGYTATQTTVSRDIKDLRLVKILSPETGRHRYAVAPGDTTGHLPARLRHLFRECVIAIEAAQNIVVFKTLPGMGQAAATVIDAMREENAVGTLGGDDTVFTVMKDNQCAEQFCLQAREMLK